MQDRSELIYFKKNGFFKAPKYLQIEITDYCPLNCPQCYKTETNSLFMDKSIFKEIVLQAKKMKLEHIFYNGGEPLTHPCLKDFINMVYEQGIEQTIFTSGYMISKEFIHLARKTNLHINLSLNGSSKDVNGLSRDGYEMTLQSARLLQKLNYPFQINWVARADNVRNLPELINLGKQIGASSINVVCNKITAKGDLISPLSQLDYVLLVETIRKNQEYIMIQNCYGLLLHLMGTPYNKLYGCQAGVRVMAVTCKGEFMPCTHLHYPEKFENIMEYWNKSVYLNQLRSIKNTKFCDTCNLCRFCHSMSKEAHDDFYVGFEKCPVKGVKQVESIIL